MGAVVFGDESPGVLVRWERVSAGCWGAAINRRFGLLRGLRLEFSQAFQEAGWGGGEFIS